MFKHALELHILIHDFYSLSDELISYAAESLFKFAIICNFSLYLADKANMLDETGSK